MDPRNKVALVTGGGIGLGKAISLKLAAAGSKIAVAYLSSPKNANETVAKIEAIGGQAMAVHADVSSSDDVRSMVDSVVEQFGRIDILVNNAATRVIVPFSDLDALKEEDWDRIIAVNLRGPFLCAKAVAPAMKLTRSRKDHQRHIDRWDSGPEEAHWRTRYRKPARRCWGGAWRSLYRRRYKSTILRPV